MEPGTSQGQASRVSVEELLEQLQITQTELEKVRVSNPLYTDCTIITTLVPITLKTYQLVINLIILIWNNQTLTGSFLTYLNSQILKRNSISIIYV